MFFALSSASLGFCGALLLSDQPVFGGCGTCLYLLASAFFFLTILFSIAATVTRLFDFRLTAKKVHAETDKKSQAEIDRLGSVARCLGKWTWALFYCQIVGFLLGVVILIFALLQLFHHRLFP